MENINRTINQLKKYEKKYELFLSEISNDFIYAYSQDEKDYLSFDKENQVNTLFYDYLDNHYNEYNEVDLFQWLKENQEVFNDYMKSQRFEEMKNDNNDLEQLICDCMWYDKLETLLLEENTIIKVLFLKKIIRELENFGKYDTITKCKTLIEKGAFDIIKIMDKINDCREINETVHDILTNERVYCCAPKYI